MQIVKIMIVFIFSILFITVVFLLLGFKIFFVKDGEFPNGHIGGSKALKEKGVHCATTQDRLDQKTGRENRFDFARMSNVVEDSISR